MNPIQIKNFTMHGESGVAVLDKDFLKWLESHKSSELGARIVAYSWVVNNECLMTNIDISRIRWEELPDASGFICFESEWKPDNCLLLDAYGKERMRLTVPWELTGLDIPKNAVMTFKNISDPYKNPKDGKVGQFGVSAYIEGSGSGGYAEGDWYFELDYHTGKFLWGSEIRS